MFAKEFITPNLAFILSSPMVALVGAACVAIPIIIHLLFRRRRRPVQWATMRFVIEAWQVRRRRILLQKNILLLIRCCIPLLLGIALAEPILSSDDSWSNRRRSYYIILDDSPVTSTRVNSERTELDTLKDSTLDIISKLDTNTNIYITTTTDPEIRRISQEEADQFIHTIEPNLKKPNISESIDTIKRTMEVSDINTIHIVSPFRTGSIAGTDPFDIEWPPDTQLFFNTPTSTLVENVGIQSVEPLRGFRIPDSPWDETEEQAITHLVRQGTKLPRETTTLRMSTPHHTTTTETVWEEGQTESYVYTRVPKHEESEVPITTTFDTSDPLHLDDVWYSKSRTLETINSIFITKQLSTESPDWFELSLNPTRSDSIDIQKIHPAALQQSDFDDVSLVFVSSPELIDGDSAQFILDYFNNGGLVIMTPPDQGTNSDWVHRITADFNIPWSIDPTPLDLVPSQTLNLEGCSSGILGMILDELPDLLQSTQVYKRLNIEIKEEEDVILRFKDNFPAVGLHEARNGSGSFILFSFKFDTSWTNLPTQPLIVPLVQELVWGALGRLHTSNRITTGETVTRKNKKPKHMSLDDGNRIPFDLDTDSTITTIDIPGTWMLTGSEPELIPVNIDPTCLSTDVNSSHTIKGIFGTGWSAFKPETPTNDSRGDFRLLPPLLLLLLILLLCETILGRTFSNSTAPQTQGGVST